MPCQQLALAPSEPVGLRRVRVEPRPLDLRPDELAAGVVARDQPVG
jgi:hypothetical protein